VESYAENGQKMAVLQHPNGLPADWLNAGDIILFFGVNIKVKGFRVPRDKIS
jgi:hypothetical protein